MQRFTLTLVVVIITSVLGGLPGAGWVARHFSLVEKRRQPPSGQFLRVSPVSLSQIQTVAFCDLLSHPGDYDQRVIRVQADLFSSDDLLTLSDPSSCALPDPMVGLELDPSFQFDASDEGQREVHDLLRSEGPRKDGRSRITVVGRFEGPIFSKDKRRGKYPYWFIVTQLEKADPVSGVATFDEPTVGFCDLVQQPERYNRKVVRTNATVVGDDYENAFLFSSECKNRKAYTHFRLENDQVTGSLRAALGPFRKGKVSGANVTIVGEFLGPNKEGYGHLNRYRFEFLIKKVEMTK